MIVMSCSKDSENVNSYTEPITISSPTQNPSLNPINTPIAFTTTFTSDFAMDSVGVYYMIDSTNTSNNIDSFDLHKQKYMHYYFPVKNTIQTITGVITPSTFPPRNGQVRIEFVLFKNDVKYKNKYISVIMK